MSTQLAQDCGAGCFVFLRWTNFSDTRWGGVGPSARHFVSSMHVGLQALVEIVDKEGVNNERHHLLAVRTRLSTRVRKVAAVAALSSYAMEGVTMELLQDDRWLKRAPELLDEMQMDLQWLEGLPQITWEALATIVNDHEWTWPQAKHDVLMSCRTSLAYFHKEAVADLSRFPLSLTQGCIRANVAKLAASPEPPPTPLGAKLHCCARLFEQDTVDALTLLLEAPCSIGLVEKGHAAGALIRRSHLSIGPTMLRSRAFLGECRVLLRPSMAEKSLEEHTSKFLCSLDRSRKVRYTPQNAYCSHAIDAVLVSSQGASSSQRKALSNAVVGQHASSFESLDNDQKAAYASLARQVKLRKVSELLDQASHHFAEVALHRQRIQSGELEGHALYVPKHEYSYRPWLSGV